MTDTRPLKCAVPEDKALGGCSRGGQAGFFWAAWCCPPWGFQAEEGAPLGR